MKQLSRTVNKLTLKGVKKMEKNYSAVAEYVKVINKVTGQIIEQKGGYSIEQLHGLAAQGKTTGAMLRKTAVAINAFLPGTKIPTSGIGNINYTILETLKKHQAKLVQLCNENNISYNGRGKSTAVAVELF